MLDWCDPHEAVPDGEWRSKNAKFNGKRAPKDRVQ